MCFFLLLKERFFIFAYILGESSFDVADPGVAAQLFGLVAEPLLSCVGVGQVAQRPFGRIQADVAPNDL